MLNRVDLLGPLAPPFTPGLVVASVGERELGAILSLQRVAPIKIDLAELLAGGMIRQRQIHDASVAVNTALQHGVTPLVYVENGTETVIAEIDPDQGTVSNGLAAIITGVKRRPAFTVLFGNDLALNAIAEVFGVTHAPVLGEIAARVTVRMSGEDARFPQMPVVFGSPGLVSPIDLAPVIINLRGGR